MPRCIMRRATISGVYSPERAFETGAYHKRYGVCTDTGCIPDHDNGEATCMPCSGEGNGEGLLRILKPWQEERWRRGIIGRLCPEKGNYPARAVMSSFSIIDSTARAVSNFKYQVSVQSSRCQPSSSLSTSLVVNTSISNYLYIS